METRFYRRFRLWRLPFFISKKQKNKGKERNPAPEIHRFGMAGLLEYMDCVLSELWWNNKIKRSGGLGFR